MNDHVILPSLGRCDVCDGPIVEGDRVRGPDFRGRLRFCYVCGLQFLVTEQSVGGSCTVSTLQALQRMSNAAYRVVLWESHYCRRDP